MPYVDILADAASDRTQKKPAQWNGLLQNIFLFLCLIEIFVVQTVVECSVDNREHPDHIAVLIEFFILEVESPLDSSRRQIEFGDGQTARNDSGVDIWIGE